MDMAIEVLRTQLVQDGMRPNFLGKKVRDNSIIEFISYPWQAGQELFIMVRRPNRPTTINCVSADEVEPTGVRSEDCLN